MSRLSSALAALPLLNLIGNDFMLIERKSESDSICPFFLSFGQGHEVSHIYIRTLLSHKNAASTVVFPTELPALFTPSLKRRSIGGLPPAEIGDLPSHTNNFRSKQRAAAYRCPESFLVGCEKAPLCCGQNNPGNPVYVFHWGGETQRLSR